MICGVRVFITTTLPGNSRLLIKSYQVTQAGMWRREKDGGVQEKFFQNFSVY
jgi:hypothetical protein